MEALRVEALGVLDPVVEACGAPVIVVGALWSFVRSFGWLRDRDAAAFVPSAHPRRVLRPAWPA